MAKFWNPDFQLQAKMQHRYESMFHAKKYFKLGMRHILRCNKYLKPATDNAGRLVTIVTTGEKRKPKFLGLQQCHNTWACPVCAPRLLNIYRIKLNAIFGEAIKQGYSLRMMTFTVPHYSDESADDVLTRLMQCYRDFSLYTRVMRRQKSFEAEVFGSVTATECKYSFSYGFHFHRHVVFMIKDNAAFERDFLKMREWWKKRTLQHSRYGETPKRNWLHLSPQRINTASYIAKLTGEITKTDQPKNASRDMFELLASDDDHDLEIFAEFACAVRGHRRIQRSKNLTKNLHLDAERLELEAKRTAMLGEFGSVRAVASFTEDSWCEIVEAEHDANKPHRHYLLLRAQLDGIDGVRRYCEENCLPQPLTRVPAIMDGEKTIAQSRSVA